MSCNIWEDYTRVNTSIVNICDDITDGRLAKFSFSSREKGWRVFEDLYLTVSQNSSLKNKTTFLYVM